MLVNDLNKIVNLFLVGSLVLVCIFSFDYPDFQNIKLLNEEFGTIATLSLIPIIFVLGLIIDAISDIFIRGLLIEKISFKCNALMTLFLVRESKSELEYTEKIFDNLLAKNQEYHSLNKEIRHFTDTSLNDSLAYGKKVFATAIFQKTAPPTLNSWLVQHFSMHLLATNYYVIALVYMIALATVNLNFFFPILFTFSLILYVLMYSAIERYIYSYKIIFRQAILVVSSNMIVTTPTEDVVEDEPQEPIVTSNTEQDNTL